MKKRMCDGFEPALTGAQRLERRRASLFQEKRAHQAHAARTERFPISRELGKTGARKANGVDGYSVVHGFESSAAGLTLTGVEPHFMIHCVS